MIYLDSHIVVWLYAGLVDKFSQPVKTLMNENEVFISPIVRLELQYLFEIQRVKDNANVIMADLSNRLGLQVCDKDFDAIVSQAMAVSWTRDPFDRVIVANAALHDNVLISKDQNILDNYVHARW
ncbi:MAG: PIN domain-containing protein [Anaerolineales bacterium]|nr:PIN domain-containing protein [Anaerolineales bacterium]